MAKLQPARGKKRRKSRVSLPYDLVMVEWIDASRLSDGWMDLVAIPDPYPHRCISVGFVVRESMHGKTLVPTVGDVEHADNSHTYGGMMIPTAAIVSETVLRRRAN